MTTSYFTVGPQLQAGDGSYTTWTNRRSMQGGVYARYSDVSVNGNPNFQWISADGTIDLLGDDGHNYGSAYLHKQWGVLPGYVYVGYVGVARPIHLATSIACVTGYNSYGTEIYSAVNWTMQIYCDNII